MPTDAQIRLQNFKPSKILNRAAPTDAALIDPHTF